MAVNWNNAYLDQNSFPSQMDLENEVDDESILGNLEGPYDRLKGVYWV